METKRFAIVGTDARQAAAGRALERAGCAVSGAEQVARADCILLRESTRTLWGANILLLGFGPVGQALGVRLAALGADVTVCARRPEQRALAESLGLRGAELARLGALAPAFDRVVNTIPAPVLTEPVLTALRPGSLIVDLASKPGGTDFAAAQRLGLRAIHALSLPAVCAPETAGEAVARTVLAILREREECT